MNINEKRYGKLPLRSIVSLIILIISGALLLWMTLNLGLPEPEEMREIILSYGWAGWLIFLGTIVVIAITPIPITVLALVAGSLYGLVMGTLLSLSGVMIGSWIGYWLARALGQRIIFQILGRHSSMVENYLRNAGFWAICTARLMPGLPYWPVNYSAGVLGVNQYAFVTATFLSSIPGQISLVALGAFVFDPSVLHGVVVIVAWIAVLILTWVSYRHWSRTKHHENAEE